MSSITLAKKLNSKLHLFFVNGSLLAVGFYFTFQKWLGISASDWMAHVFSVKAAVVIKVAAIVWVGYCCLMRLLLTFYDHFPASLTKQAEPESVNQCTLRINDEIKRHLAQLEAEPQHAAAHFVEAHAFEVNVQLVLANLADHLLRSFSGVKLKSRDVFISVYKVPGFENATWAIESLEYVRHFDPQRDVVASRKINLTDPRYVDYECVKTIASRAPVQVRFDCEGYAASAANRHKHVKHYVGFRLEIEDKTIGFINIEFHRHKLFKSEDDFREFVERELYAFRALIEYQFLKKKFFSTVKRLLIERSSKP